jgi:triacylglycerol lipase
MVDSPAYFNLTTSYLNNIFNPSTPNDPRVKYFSVAGRMGSVSVWHPLWLPKMVLDGAEEKARDQMQNEWKERMDAGIPMWKREDEWGNDGLVTVQSSRWGEFLGIMEGCDHWEMRGARGIELDVDIGLKGMPLGINLGSDGWGWREWGKLVGAWKREERRAASVGASGPVLNRVAMDARICTQEQEKERVEDEALFKSSTDKLSTVFDWLVEQVPLPAKLGSRGKSAAGTQMSGQAKSNLEAQGDDETMETERWIQRGQDRRNRNELETKLDLERFYVALSRKLYDEGL